MTVHTTHLALWLVTNNAYDSILLVDPVGWGPHTRVLSAWSPCTDDDVRELLATGHDPADWPQHDTEGLRIDGRPARIVDYGDPVLYTAPDRTGDVVIIDQRLADQRAQYWDVVWPTAAGQATA